MGDCKLGSGAEIALAADGAGLGGAATFAAGLSCEQPLLLFAPFRHSPITTTDGGAPG